MKHRAKLIEVGDGEDPNTGCLVTLIAETVEDARAIGSHLYEDVVIHTTPHIDAVLDPDPLDRLDELLGRLLLPGGKAEHVSASELHELVDEVNALRARKADSATKLEIALDALDGVPGPTPEIENAIETLRGK